MISVKELRKGSHIIHRDEPYRVLKKEIIVVGTHSHTKVKLTVQNVLSGTTEVLNMPPHTNMEDIEIIRKKGQVVANQPENLQVMDLVSYETLGATTHEDLQKELSEGDEITFIEFNGQARILEKRE